MFTKDFRYTIDSINYYVYMHRRTMMNDFKVENISAEEAKDLVDKDKSIIVLDVRTKSEYMSGHIPGAKLVPLNQLPNEIEELNDLKEKPVLVYCATGRRSLMAIKILIQNDFSNIRHLNNGISSWNYDLKK
jgi:rhodanese-related sulfurtransferase